MTEMSAKQVARQAAAAPGRIDGDRKNLGLVGGKPGDDEANGLAPGAQPVRQRVALLEQLFEFVVTPAAMKRGAVQLCQPMRVTRARGVNIGRRRAEQALQPFLHGLGAVSGASCSS